jgi:L-ascorbate metabolism protein UlaG (beta-lactamase superfamily)
MEEDMSWKNKIVRSVMTLACISMIWTAGNAGQSTIEVTFVANEGVMITTGSNKILIDALFDNPNPAYAAPPKEMLEGMEAGSPPFDDVDLVLVTHNHPDHFSPSFAARFMENNPNAVLVAATDAVSALKDNSKEWDRVQNRVFSFDLKPGETAEKLVNGIAVKLFRTLHSGNQESPHNLMYLIKMDGRTIFHEGDSDGNPETFKDTGLDEEEIELALVHFWFPLHANGERIIMDVLKPDHVWLIHLPKNWMADGPGKIDAVKSKYKDLFLFVESGEKKTIR